MESLVLWAWLYISTWQKIAPTNLWGRRPVNAVGQSGNCPTLPLQSWNVTDLPWSQHHYYKILTIQKSDKLLVNYAKEKRD